MPFVTSFERYARQEGRQEGLEEGLEQGLQTGEIRGLRQAIREVLAIRFGEFPDALAERLDASTDREQLKHWHRLAVMAPTLAAVSDEVERAR